MARAVNGRVAFVGLSFADTVDAGRAYQRQFAVPYPLALDAGGRIWGAWGVPAQPYTIFVDRQGRIAKRHPDRIPDAELRATVDWLLAE